jgi:hypothetical protein
MKLNKKLCSNNIRAIRCRVVNTKGTKVLMQMRKPSEQIST